MRTLASIKLGSLHSAIWLLSLTTSTVSMADTIPGHALVDFEAGNNGSTVTASIMTSGTKGNTWSGWKTMSNPGGAVQGSTPNLTISSSASYQLYTPALINGTVYTGTGTRGMKASMGADNAVQLNFPSPGYQLSVGFYFRFSGPQINYSPRDVVGLRADPTGGYQFLQIYDGPQPYFHAHWQPYSSGSGIGNNVNFNRNQWYWVTMKHVAGGGTFRIRFYDPSRNYALVGESTGGVSSGTQGCTTIQIGCIKYASGASQSVEFDNFIINTDGVFPLGPGTGGGFPTNQPPSAGANATPKTGVAPLSVAFSSAGSSDPEGTTLSYNWSFGDGTSSTAANPTKTYTSAGTYVARLTVSDGVNSTTSSNLTITVSAPVNQPPVVAANASPRTGVAP
ncbi:MAG TPA: PKD domain-containing protein, partial [Verrucomicrobiota bacterium]|nr:PKD domain-containing protein [Verrucomicrobiota bacterium]